MFLLLLFFSIRKVWGIKKPISFDDLLEANGELLMDILLRGDCGNWTKNECLLCTGLDLKQQIELNSKIQMITK